MAATYAPRSPTSSPPAPNKPAPSYAQTPYRRSATTTTTSPSSSSSSSSPSASKPAAASSSSSPSTGARPAHPTSAYAESQLNPVAHPPYTPPPGVGSIPEHGNYDSKGFANNGIDWSSSFHGLSTTPFSPEVAAVLMKPIPFEDVEIKPDGIIYLPEIKYRRILNQAFGPGGWGMAPRGELMVGEKVVTREYALLVHGRYVSLFTVFPVNFAPVPHK